MNDAGASRGGFALGAILLTVVSATLLSIGIAKPWRLLHEDNGAFFTTLALSHERLGLAETRAQGLFFNPHTGERILYLHHPPGAHLLLAAAFSLARSPSPAVARALSAACQIASLWIFLFLLRQFFEPAETLAGGLLFAVLPMGAFFGRMVNFEPFALLAVMLQLAAWVRVRRKPSRLGRAALALGIGLGGLFDWSALFFTAAILLVELWQWRKFRDNLALLDTIFLSAAGIAALDLLHVWYAGHESFSAIRQLAEVVRVPPGKGHFSALRFVEGQIDNYRRYFSISGLVSSILCALALLVPRGALRESVLGSCAGPLGRQYLSVVLLAPTAYVLAAPRWAKVHSYWQFFFLPFAATSLLLVLAACWRAGGPGGSRVWKGLAVVMLLEIGATSAYMLHLRHTRPGEFAVAKSREFETTFLAP